MMMLMNSIAMPCNLLTLLLGVYLMQPGLCSGSPTALGEWDHLVFSQQWPQTVCIDADATHKHECKVPTDVTTWTVHGIWPSLGKSEGPTFCNKSAKFDPLKISSIRDKLQQFWPNLYTDTELDKFWEHEWDKHGTCAMTLNSLNSELKYFSKGLQLREQFDILRILHDGNIVPSDTNTYEYSDVLNVLTNVLGITPTMNCFYDKETNTQYIIEIDFCLSTSFSIIPCPKKVRVPEVAINSRWSHTDQSIAMTQIVGNSPCRDTERIAYPLSTAV